MERKKTRNSTLCLIAALVMFAAGGVCADTMWDYQAVDADGAGAHPFIDADPVPSNLVTLTGVAIAGSDEILNPDAGSWAQYTVFIQDHRSSAGGFQVWAGSWFYGSLWPSVRASNYIDVNAGDLVRVTGYLNEPHRGKVMLNHRHSPDEELTFKVEVIGHVGIPDPVLIPSVSHCNYFDQTRSGGGEYYQTRWTMLHGVDVTGGTWANGSLMTVSDSTGSVGVKLAVVGDFNSVPQPSGKLSVVGVFDQEDTSSPHHSDYRLWVKKSADVASALDACRQVSLRKSGENVALINKVVSRVFDGYFYIQDEDRSGAVKVFSSRMVSPGDVLAVQGTVIDRSITARYITKLASSNGPRPLGVNVRSLKPENGLDLAGILVRCFGQMGSVLGEGLHEFIVDGEIVHFATGAAPVPAKGTSVVVNGIAVPGTGTGPVKILIAESNDIQPVP